jgi:type I restriction enzyme S subunit
MTESITLGELIAAHGGLIQTGPFGSQLHQSDYSEDGIPVVMPKDIRCGRVDENGIARVPEIKARALSRHYLKPGSIVFPRRGEISKCAYIDEGGAGFLCGTGCFKIEPPEEVLKPKFLYYYLGLRHVVEWLERNAVGTTMLNLNAKIIGGIRIPLVPMQTQETIVSVLSAYDDLIENNRRRIQLLEQAARLLYREWFVHLRFPGHEHATIADGVPEGWEKKKIADVCETVGGGTPSTKVSEYWEGDITWIVPSDITKNDCLAQLDSERKITEKGLRESSAKMVPAETILMTSRASVGFFALMDFEVCTNQGFINIIPHEDELRMYLLFNLMSRVTEIRSNAKGTTYPEISKGRFRGMDVVVPSKPLASEFMRFASDIIQQVRHLKRSTLQLKAARDLLLPRLMNGEVVA